MTLIINKINQIHGVLWFDRLISGKARRQLAIVILFFLLIILIATIIYFINGDGWMSLAKAFVNMTSPVSARQEVYGTKPLLRDAYGLAILYFFGAVTFTGLLIATITNIFRTRADKFKSGTVSYRFRNHVVFLGYDDLIVGMIQRLCEEYDGNICIVVGVEMNASEINDKIKNRLWKKYKDKVVVLLADSCNRSDLKERMQVHYAQRVYIIGEHDDAYNLKSYRTIYEVSLSTKDFDERMPQCYVNLRHQSTLTLFQTYATTGDIGLDFSYFHPFNFCDEWARYMIVGNDLNQEYRIDRNGDIGSHQLHLVIVGMTEMGKALARQAMLLCHYPPMKDKSRFKITFIDSEASKYSEHFIGQFQRLFDRCRYTVHNATGDEELRGGSDILDFEFEFWEADISNVAFREKVRMWVDDPQQMLTMAICLPDAAQSLAAGMYLPDIIYRINRTVPVWIYQPTLGDIGYYLRGAMYKNVVTFGMLGEQIDVSNGDDITTAQKINHFIANSDMDGFGYNNAHWIEKEWQKRTIYEKWEYINQATYWRIIKRQGGLSDEMIAASENALKMRRQMNPKPINIEQTIVDENWQCAEENQRNIEALRNIAKLKNDGKE